MIPQALANRVASLRDQINDLRYQYHVLNNPEVTDAMYEGLVAELRKIEEKYPEIITTDSPTQRVAGKPLDKFEKVIHQAPQWSFNDAFAEEDMRDWEERIMKILEKELGRRPVDLVYVCELKIDGLHLVLTYIKGLLKTAATRGDGKVGEDVTQNIRTIETAPLRLKSNVDLIAEGEVWLSNKMFNILNEERKRVKEPLFANPRNAAAGTIRQLDSRIVAERKLRLTAYDVSEFRGKFDISTQEKELKLLRELGFYTDSHWKVCKTIDEVLSFWQEWQRKRNSQEFWIDGIVVKVNQKKYQDILGYTGKAPRWAIALKFSAEQGTTKIKDIYVQVGRTGALTPVALMDPVKLAGTTVTHATLHNFDEIKRLDARINDMVVVEKAGDIIPKVVRVLDKMRTGAEKRVRVPRKCPICHSAVKRVKISEKKTGISAALFCVNSKCYAQELERIIHFISKHAFDIDGLGEKIVEQLMNEGLLKNAADIFNLKKGDLEPLERFAEKSAENLINAIESVKNISLPRFIYALGIHHVGEETAIRLAQKFNNVHEIMNASLEKLMEVSDIGPRVAASIKDFFTDKENQKLVKELFKNGVIIKEQEVMNRKQKNSGKTFVLTGTLTTMTRDEAKERIRQLGGEISSSVSSNTNYVVVGKNPGSKFDQAKKLGVRILDEMDFINKL